MVVRQVPALGLATLVLTIAALGTAPPAAAQGTGGSVQALEAEFYALDYRIRQWDQLQKANTQIIVPPGLDRDVQRYTQLAALLHAARVQQTAEIAKKEEAQGGVLAILTNRKLIDKAVGLLDAKIEENLKEDQFYRDWYAKWLAEAKVDTGVAITANDAATPAQRKALALQTLKDAAVRRQRELQTTVESYRRKRVALDAFRTTINTALAAADIQKAVGEGEFFDAADTAIDTGSAIARKVYDKETFEQVSGRLEAGKGSLATLKKVLEGNHVEAGIEALGVIDGLLGDPSSDLKKESGTLTLFMESDFTDPALRSKAMQVIGIAADRKNKLDQVQLLKTRVGQAKQLLGGGKAAYEFLVRLDGAIESYRRLASEPGRPATTTRLIAGMAALGNVFRQAGEYLPPGLRQTLGPMLSYYGDALQLGDKIDQLGRDYISRTGACWNGQAVFSNYPAIKSLEAKWPRDGLCLNDAPEFKAARIPLYLDENRVRDVEPRYFFIPDTSGEPSALTTAQYTALRQIASDFGAYATILQQGYRLTPSDAASMIATILAGRAEFTIGGGIFGGKSYKVRDLKENVRILLHVREALSSRLTPDTAPDLIESWKRFEEEVRFAETLCSFSLFGNEREKNRVFVTFLDQHEVFTSFLARRKLVEPTSSCRAQVALRGAEATAVGEAAGYWAEPNRALKAIADVTYTWTATGSSARLGGGLAVATVFDTVGRQTVTVQAAGVVGGQAVTLARDEVRVDVRQAGTTELSVDIRGPSAVTVGEAVVFRADVVARSQAARDKVQRGRIEWTAGGRRAGTGTLYRFEGRAVGHTEIAASLIATDASGKTSAIASAYDLVEVTTDRLPSQVTLQVAGPTRVRVGERAVLTAVPSVSDATDAPVIDRTSIRWSAAGKVLAQSTQLDIDTSHVGSATLTVAVLRQIGGRDAVLAERLHRIDIVAADDPTAPPPAAATASTPSLPPSPVGKPSATPPAATPPAAAKTPAATKKPVDKTQTASETPSPSPGRDKTGEDSVVSFGGTVPGIWDGGNNPKGFDFKRQVAKTTGTGDCKWDAQVQSDISGRIDPSFSANTPEKISTEVSDFVAASKAWGKATVVRPFAIGDFKGQFVDTSVAFYPGGWSDAGFRADGVSAGGRGWITNGRHTVEIAYSVAGSGCWTNVDRAFLESQAAAAQADAKSIVASLTLVEKGLFSKVPYTGPKLDGSDMPRVTLSPPVLEKLKVGDTVTVSVVVENAKAEDRPFRYSWAGDLEGKPGTSTDRATITIKPKKPGKYPLSVSVDGARYALGSASLEYEVADLKAEITQVSPATKSMPIGVPVTFSATLLSSGVPVTGNYVYRWQPTPELTFQPPEGPARQTKTVFSRPGVTRVWVQILERKGTVLTTVAESNQLEIEVVQPEVSLRVFPADPYPGQEVRITASEAPAVSDAFITYWWEYAGSAINPGAEANPRVYTFRPKDTTAVTVTAHAKARDGGDDLGTKTIVVTARPHDVRVTGPTARGPKPQVWSAAARGLVEEERQLAVFQDVSMRADVAPAPVNQPLHYQWGVSPDGCSISNPASQAPTFNCSQTGGYNASVTVRDNLGARLGTGAGTISISISQASLQNSRAQADAAKAAQQAKLAMSDRLRAEGEALRQQGKLREAIAKYRESLTYVSNPAMGPFIAQLEAFAVTQEQVALQAKLAAERKAAIEAAEPVPTPGARPVSKPPVAASSAVSDRVPATGGWVLERTEFVVEKVDPALMQQWQPVESGADGAGSARVTIGGLKLNMKVAWSSPPKVLVPGKQVDVRLTISDAGSDQFPGMFHANVRANCPALSAVWYGPEMSLQWSPSERSKEASKAYTPPSAAPGTTMYITAEWSVGFRRSTFYYFYKFTLDASNGPAPVSTSSAPAAAPPAEVAVFDSMNVYGVGSQPTAPATFTIQQPHVITSIMTYHWNGGRGTRAGTIALRDARGRTYGPWPVSGTPGQGGVPNAAWTCNPGVEVPTGTYTIVDSEPATWSQNPQSGGRGMAAVKGRPTR